MKMIPKLEGLKANKNLFDSTIIFKSIIAGSTGFYTLTEIATNNAKDQVCEMDPDYSYDYNVCK
jgi:hypothetical protein